MTYRDPYLTTAAAVHRLALAALGLAGIAQFALPLVPAIGMTLVAYVSVRWACSLPLPDEGRWP